MPAVKSVVRYEISTDQLVPVTQDDWDYIHVLTIRLLKAVPPETAAAERKLYGKQFYVKTP